jgi:hypothetical protein
VGGASAVPAEGLRIVVCMNQTPVRDEAGKVRRFGRDVLQAALVDLTSKALLYVGGGLVAAFLFLKSSTIFNACFPGTSMCRSLSI